MGLLSKVGTAAATPPAPAAPVAQIAASAAPAGGMLGGLGVQAPPAQPAGPTPEQIAAERARLAAEEAAAVRARMIPPGFADDIAFIEQRGLVPMMFQGAYHDKGRGFPMLVGNAARAYSALKGIDAQSFTGTGIFGKITIDDGAYESSVAALAAELRNELAQEQAVPQNATPVAPPIAEQPPTMGILPPGTPQSDPRLAYQPLDGAIAGSALDPAAIGAAAAQQMTNVLAQAPQTPPPATTPGPGQNAATPPAGAPAAAAKAPRTRKPRTPKATEGTSVNVFVDCAPEHDCLDLQPYIDEQLAKLLAAPELGLKYADPRLALDGPLAFGRWRAVLEQMAQDAPPPPGDYKVDTRGNEIAEAICRGLRIVCAKTGGDFVRGYR